MKTIAPSSHSTPWAAALLIIAILGASPLQSLPSGDQISLPEFDKESLLNGLEILFVPSSQPQAQFLLMIRNGAAFDPVDKWGATLLTSRMLLHDTALRTAEQLRFSLEEIQARLEVRVEHDAIYYYGQAPSRRLSDALQLLGEIVTQPRFDEETFERLRGQLIAEQQRKAETLEYRTEQELAERIFVPHPYGRPIVGTPSSLSSLTLTDIKIQYRRLFMPNQAQLALYHSGDRHQLMSSMGRGWGRWVRQKALPFTFRRAPHPEGGRVFLIDTPSEDALMRWGRLAVTRSDPDYYTWKVFEQYVLLHLPEWARQIDSSQSIQASPRLEAHRMPGFIELSIQAPPQQLLDYLKLWRRFLKETEKGNIDQQHFEEARRLARREFSDALQQPRSCLEVLLEMTLYEVGAGYVTTHGMRLDRVTPQRIAQALRDLPPDDFALVVAGPASTLRKGLEGLGPIESVAFQPSEPQGSGDSSGR